MNIYVNICLSSYTAAAHITFVCYYKCGGKLIYRICSVLIVVTDGADDFCSFFGRHTHFVQQSESHYSTGLCVVNSVYNIADRKALPKRRLK